MEFKLKNILEITLNNSLNHLFPYRHFFLCITLKNVFKVLIKIFYSFKKETKIQFIQVLLKNGFKFLHLVLNDDNCNPII